MNYNVGDILENRDGIMYLIVEGTKATSYFGTKETRKQMNKIKKEGIELRNSIDIFDKIMSNGKSIRSYYNGNRSHVCVKEMEDINTIVPSNRTFYIPTKELENFNKIAKITVRDIKDLMKENYVKQGILSENSKLEYVLPETRFYNYMSYIKDVGRDSQDMDDYYFDRMYKVYFLEDYDETKHDSELLVIVGKFLNKRTNKWYTLLSDDSNPCLLQDKWTDGTYRKPSANRVLSSENNRNYYRVLEEK